MASAKCIKKSRIWFIVFIVIVLALELILVGCNYASESIRPTLLENSNGSNGNSLDRF